MLEGIKAFVADFRDAGPVKLFQQSRFVEITAPLEMSQTVERELSSIAYSKKIALTSSPDVITQGTDTGSRIAQQFYFLNFGRFMPNALGIILGTEYQKGLADPSLEAGVRILKGLRAKQAAELEKVAKENLAKLLSPTEFDQVEVNTYENDVTIGDLLSSDYREARRQFRTKFAHLKSGPAIV